MLEINYNGRNYKINDDIKKYLQEKLSKHAELLQRATSINAIMTQNNTSEGQLRNYKVEVQISMPNAFIKIEEKGKGLHSIIDNIEVIIKRRLKRYNQLSKRWEKELPWKAREIDREYNKYDYDNEVEITTDFEPEIKRKEYENDSPLHPAEAIEQMELLGHNSFLFKNIENGKYGMIYKRDDGAYGLIQPK
jgi:putative sigma-54 modulation protein